MDEGGNTGGAHKIDRHDRQLEPSPANLGVSDCKIKPLAEGDLGGTTRLSFRPMRVGAMRISVLYGAFVLGGEATKWSVIPAATHPDGCTVLGAGAIEATAGELATVVVQTRDLFGNVVSKGGEVVSAELRGKSRSPVVATVAAQNNGEYLVSYLATAGGEHELHVFVRREPAAGSPFPIIVHASRTVGPMCDVDTRQLVGVRVGVEAPFRITAFDRHKNRALRGGDAFHALVRPPDGGECVELILEDQVDGTYIGHITCRVMGVHHLEVLLEGTPLPASPVAIHVEAGPPRALCSIARANFLQRSVDPTGEAVRPGASSSPRPIGRVLQAGVEELVHLSAMDANGNQAFASPRDWHVRLDHVPIDESSPPALLPTVQATSDAANCVVAVRLLRAGEYRCIVSLRGEPVMGSPYNLKVRPGPVNAARSGLEASTQIPLGIAGLEGHIVLVCRDACGNQLERGGTKQGTNPRPFLQGSLDPGHRGR